MAEFSGIFSSLNFHPKFSVQARLKSQNAAVCRLTIARFTVVMTLLATEVGLEEAFRTFRMTFTSSQLPSRRALHALIPAWPTTRITAQITLDTTAAITVIAVNDNVSENVVKLNRRHVTALIKV